MCYKPIIEVNLFYHLFTSLAVFNTARNCITQAAVIYYCLYNAQSDTELL